MAERPVRRAYQVYLYAVCFIATIVVLISATRALLGLVHIAFPDGGAHSFDAPYFEDQGFGFPMPKPDRSRGVAELLEGLVLTGMGGALFVVHWRRAKASPPEPAAD